MDNLFEFLNKQTTQEKNNIEKTKHEKAENQSLILQKDYNDKEISKATTLKIASNRETSAEQHDEPDKTKATNVKSGSHKVPRIYHHTIRERIIHLLALKPYKKLELYARLQSEGIRKAEQSIIGNILSDIALLRDKAYRLKSYVWKYVQGNWPYYTAQQQQQIKLDKAENLRNLSSLDDVSTISNESLDSLTSPIPSPESKIENKNCLKRAFVEYEVPRAAKKRRISHALVHQSTFEDTHIPDQQSTHSTTNDQKNQHHEHVLQTTVTDYGESPTQLSSVSQIDTAASGHDFSRYSTITSIEQRRKYKANFEIYYKEYVPLLRRVEEVRYKFRELPAQLQQVPEGSPEFERIKNQILLEYERLNSQEEIGLKQRFDYLEAKLLHIKQLVDDYDEKWLTEKAMQAAIAAAKEYRNEDH